MLLCVHTVICVCVERIFVGLCMRVGVLMAHTTLPYNTTCDKRSIHILHPHTQVISNCVSIHQLKARTGCASLREHFCDKYTEGSPEFHKAQRNFVESMASYSIICYLLQIKDRHNGNIMIDDEGHVVHIDFGFMLSNSPGGVNFESAPFKLTRELLEVMDSNSEGKASELFDYFKVCVGGGVVGGVVL